MIRLIQENELGTCLDLIHTSFATVANDFHLTRENCPGHTSFMPMERLKAEFSYHVPMFCYEKDGKMIGYFSLIDRGNGNFELNNLSVLPDYRHDGIGAKMVQFAKEKVQEFGGTEMSIGIIDENEILKKWYTTLGFVYLGSKKFDGFPFTAGFMTMKWN